MSGFADLLEAHLAPQYESELLVVVACSATRAPRSARSTRLAELIAREMRHLTLEDALELVILYAEKDDAKFERAACRWLIRLTNERENLTLAEAQVAAVALGGLRNAPLTPLRRTRRLCG